MNQNNLMINMLLGQLRSKNPSAYNEVQGLMNSGKSPDQILNELLQSGRFTPDDVNKAINASKGNNNIKRF